MLSYEEAGFVKAVYKWALVGGVVLFVHDIQ